MSDLLLPHFPELLVMLIYLTVKRIEAAEFNEEKGKRGKGKEK